MRIVGASFDAPEKNQRWAEAESYPFELWSDAERGLALHYGAATAPDQRTSKRMSFLLDAEGNVALAYRRVSARSHPAEVLEDCRELFGG